MLPRPPRSPLFPYTTLFRSSPHARALVDQERAPATEPLVAYLGRVTSYKGAEVARDAVARLRSEEHTSELQSRQYLVCRLLLEKKNKKNSISINLLKLSANE